MEDFARRQLRPLIADAAPVARQVDLASFRNAWRDETRQGKGRNAGEGAGGLSVTDCGTNGRAFQETAPEKDARKSAASLK